MVTGFNIPDQNLSMNLALNLQNRLTGKLV